MFNKSLVFSLFLFVSGSLNAQKPTAAQLEWHATEFYFFIHFGPNTFTDKEWGEGTEAEDMFSPSELDCEQWCKIALSAGAKGIVITAKHHDGFCLWPSAYSKHTVRESPWKNGKGDVLRELSDACKKYGLKLGFYLSPWDRNHPKYGTPEYNDIYVAAMTELMTQYGDLFEFWWDGANGEGPNGKRQVYDFHRYEQVAARLQPNAVIFSDIGPGCRWAGNEQGTINETNWCMLDTAGFARGAGGPPSDTLQRGNIQGKNWIPAECDVSIRPGWFFHSNEDDQVKTPEQLWDIYLKSVGRGANLILNIPPSRTGKIHPNDSTSLAEFGRMKSRLLTPVPPKNILIGGKKFKKQHWLSDGKMDTYIPMPSNKAPQYIEVALPSKASCAYVKIQEFIADGQWISGFRLEAYDYKIQQWKTVGQGTTIGARRIIALPEGTETDRIRIWVTGTRNGKKAKISEIAVCPK